MKKCPYCGALLHDGDRFCLHCMKLLFSPRTLPPYGKRRYPFFLIFILLSLILPMLVLSGLYLHISPGDAADAVSVSNGNSLLERQLSENASDDASGTVDVQEKTDSKNASSNEESNESQIENAVSTSESKSENAASSKPQKGANEENAKTPSDESPKKNLFLSPKEFFEKMALLEEQELKSQLPNAIRTEEDLGPYSQRMVVENRFSLISRDDFDSVYKKTPGWRLDLAETVLNTFQGDMGMGYGTTGKYRWKLIRAELVTNAGGLQEYYIQVRIQVQVDDPAVYAYGVDTLSVVRQVRSHLDQRGQRINALPQSCNGNFISLILDPTGIAFDGVNAPRNQQEMVEILCEKLDSILAEYGYSDYRFDFRLAFVRPEANRPDVGSFTFVYYFEPA